MNQTPSAIVTGGSAGLGTVIAQKLDESGYRITISGRNAERLNELAAVHPTWRTFAGDATQSETAVALVQQHAEVFGGLDVLVNVVGQSDRGRVDALHVDRLRELFEANVVSTLVHCGAAMESLRASRGVIVNIGSLAGRVAPGYLGGYVAAKHALSGLTRQMRLELKDTGVHVGLICPGPIAREDAGQRYSVDEHDDIPSGASGPGGGAKLKGLSPESVADAVLQCIRERRIEVVMPWKVRLLMAIDAVSPALADRLLARKMPA
ncbi:MAG: SDR family NAD(P)-dependent oxidoreductase [Planctomycetota bacterium]